jgi:radical SAM protein with 4Fe4S-binding SPASM domain
MNDKERWPEPPVRPGVYHYQQFEGEWPTRFHLRVDPDGGGILIANAAKGVSLSTSGVLMAHGLLEGHAHQSVITDVRRAFRGASYRQVAEDVLQVKQVLEDLSAPGDKYPISNLSEPGLTDWEREMAAPLRADIVQGPPNTVKQMLQVLWEAGVPHAMFLVQPDDEAAQLPHLVEAAEDIGMIAGLRSVASWIGPDVVENSAMAGLDHLDLVYISHVARQHDALAGAGDYDRVRDRIAQAKALELCPVAQVPLMESNAVAVDEIAQELAKIEVANIVFYALACPDDDEDAQTMGALPARTLPQIAALIEETSEDTLGRYLWAPPVRFDTSRTLAEQALAGPRTAGDVAIRVEADGSVFPPRGKRECAGNLLEDAWDMIWGSDCFHRYRERLETPGRCRDCPDLLICAADCPKDPSGWSDDREGEEHQ